MRRPLVFALLFALLPTAALAQGPAPRQRSSTNKLKWIGVGGVLSGIGLALAGAAASQPSHQISMTTPTTQQSPCIGGGTCVATIIGGPAIGGSTTPPLFAAFPGSIGGSPTTFVTVPGRGANWKMIVPAIGAAGAGAFVIYRSHSNAKRVTLNAHPNGAAQLSYNW